MWRNSIVLDSLLNTPSSPFSPRLLENFHHRYLSCFHHFLTDWGREPLSVSLSSQWVKCSNCIYLSTWKNQDIHDKAFMMGHWWRMSANMLATVGSQGASIQHDAIRVRSLNWPVTCPTWNLDRTSGTKAGGWNAPCLTCPRVVESIQSQGYPRGKDFSKLS